MFRSLANPMSLVGLRSANTAIPHSEAESNSSDSSSGIAATLKRKEL